MKKILLFGFILSLFLNSCQQKIKVENNEKPPVEISFITNDSVTIYGDLYNTHKEASTIMLFHQARSCAKGEYRTIIPRLLRKGYNVLAIDQRMGGQQFGNYNRTIARFPANAFTYCDAYADLEGALKYVIESGFKGPKIAWGSSYSAALAIRLASNHQDQVSGVLAFSPSSGGPMKLCSPNEHIKSLTIPLLLLRPVKEMEMESVNDQFKLAKHHNHQVYVAENGTHGSSMLVKQRVNKNVDANWIEVLSFLDSIEK